MDYQLLKINKVTKLCDDRILMDEKGNVLDIQWFDFQLNKLCDLLTISNFDNVHCPKIFHDGNPRPADNNYTNLFTRNQIFRALKNKYGSKSHGENDLVSIPDSDISGHIEDLENIGFSTSKVHKLFIPKLNKDNECFVNPISHLNGTILEQDPFYTEDESVIKLMMKHSKKDDFEYNEDLSDDEESPVDLLSQDHSETKTDECLNYGKIIWNKNSCYADSPIFLIFLRMLQNKDSPLSKRLLEGVITDENINDKMCYEQEADGSPFTAKSNWDSALILNKILIEFRVLFEKFKRGENFSIDSLRKLFGECNGSVTRKWGISDSGQSFEGKFEDADEFLQDLFRMLQIKYPPITNESRTNKFTEYYYSTENEHLDLMRKRIKIFGEASFNEFQVANGENMFNDKKEIINEDPVDVQYLALDPQSFISEFKFRNPNLSKFEATREEITNQSNVLLNENIQTFIKKSDRLELKKQLTKSTISMQFLTDVKSIIETGTPTDLGIISYHMKDKEYELNDDNTKFFKKDEPGTLIDITELGDKGFKQAFKLQHSQLDNQSHDIFLFLRRLISPNKLIKLRVVDIDKINIDGTNYYLNGAVYWKNNHYMTLFKCNNIWYHFDDGAGKGAKINKIGSYSQLLNYDNKIIQKNTTIYHYVRE